MIFEEPITTSSPEEEDNESIDCDECDHQTSEGRTLQLSPILAKELIKKQLSFSTEGQHWSGSLSCSSTPLSDDCSLSSLSVCCSPVSRMSSPSPSSVCGTPTHLHSQYSPTSTLTTIRNAVSHLTRLDDFNVVKLSQGFFSQVFKVTHHSSKKVMVLKMNKQAGNRGNALKEIELLNKLNHENIVAFMGTVVHEGGLHPLLEYINGGTLERLIRQYYKIDTYFDENKRLITRHLNNNKSHNNSNISNNNSNNNNKYNYCPQIYRLNDVNQTFVKLAEDIARGMDYLHSIQILHRDLTSKNVLIRKLPPIFDDTDEFDAEPYLVAVIGDFGFATSEPSKDHKLSTVGSPYWMAPECIKGQWYNHKCDIFSYGIICCELNWRLPADPDYLCRDDNFLINFDKMPALPKETLLARIARLCCQKNASIRPEFAEILEIFETEIMSDKNGFNPKMRLILRRDLSLSSSNSSFDSIQIDGTGDIFDQHLIRRRNSQIERKYFNGTHS